MCDPSLSTNLRHLWPYLFILYTMHTKIISQNEKKVLPSFISELGSWHLQQILMCQGLTVWDLHSSHILVSRLVWFGKPYFRTGGLCSLVTAFVSDTSSNFSSLFCLFLQWVCLFKQSLWECIFWWLMNKMDRFMGSHALYSCEQFLKWLFWAFIRLVKTHSNDKSYKIMFCHW